MFSSFINSIFNKKPEPNKLPLADAIAKIAAADCFKDSKEEIVKDIINDRRGAVSLLENYHRRELSERVGSLSRVNKEEAQKLEEEVMAKLTSPAASINP